MNSMPSPFDDLADGAAVGRSDESRAERAPQSLNAGFGAPGADATVKRIDLNDALIRHPQATFRLRAQGHAMAGAGIGDGAVLVVDRAIQPSSGHVVIAVVEGELMCRQLVRDGAGLQLRAADAGVEPFVPAEGEQLEVWGVVTTVIQSLLP